MPKAVRPQGLRGFRCFLGGVFWLYGEAVAAAAAALTCSRTRGDVARLQKRGEALLPGTSAEAHGRAPVRKRLVRGLDNGGSLAVLAGDGASAFLKALADDAVPCVFPAGRVAAASCFALMSGADC